LSGLLAATVVTWFTFLPSFIFIFLGGPVIEATRQELKLTSPLTATYTRSIVGVILNLAVFLGMRVLMPQGLDSSFNAVSFFILSKPLGPHHIQAKCNQGNLGISIGGLCFCAICRA
jgi:chromate transporter